MKIISREHFLEYERDKYKRWYELAVDESRRNSQLKKDMQTINKSCLFKLYSFFGWL